MDDELKKLSFEIVRQRARLNKLTEQGLSSGEMLRQSRLLDELIDKFQNLKKQRNIPPGNEA